MSVWDELLDEFRALGGTADNIRLGHGDFGRGLFPIDPAKPVALHIPDNLLVAVENMVFAGRALRVGPKARTGEREKAWLNRYQDEFAWGGEGGDEIRRIFELAGALAEELRHALSKEHHCGSWFDEPTNELIQSQFLEARTIEHGGHRVVMPLVEMANHGTGGKYEGSSGVGLSGIFSGEVLVQYTAQDPFGFFLAFGFTEQRPVAFSIPLRGTLASLRLKIRRRFPGATASEFDWIPQFAKQAGEGVLTFLMLGNERFPRLSKGIFYRLMRKAGYTGFEEAFDLVHHLNRLHFIKLLEALEGVNQPMAATLRNMARYQLRAMSFCYGVREI